MQKVSFQSGGLTIRGTIVMPISTSKPFPGVIIFHGMTSSDTGYISFASKLAEHGIAGLAISMRGHGDSEGDFYKATVAEAINDALAAYDFLIAQDGIDANRIGMLGSSVGAILAAMAAEKRPVQSLVFRAPAAYTKEMMQLSMAGTMVNEEQQFHDIDNLEDTPAGQAIADFAGSFLVVVSENDAIIPLTVPSGYLDIAKHSNKKGQVLIKGATHTLTETIWKDTFTTAATDWFLDNL